ncbi:hypothetical protein V3C99_005535 [Haemonchus contortus]
MKAWTRLRPNLLRQRRILKPKQREVYVGNGVFMPLSSTQVEPARVIEMPTSVSYPVPLIDENSRTSVEYDFDAIFNHPQVMIRDREAVEKKLRVMVEAGKEKLMVISDFDYTLSRFEDNLGGRCWTTHGVFDNCSKQVDPELASKLQRLKERYFPVEFDPKMTQEQKVPYMEQWWNSSHNHIVSARFHRSTVENFVRNSKIILRDQAEQMIIRLNQLGVPLVVFSAGIGNIIEMYLEQRLGQIPTNIRIISNMMNFDESGVVVSFSQPLIHTFCKNSSVIRKEASFFHNVNGRTSVILLGDSMGDIHMDVGVEKDGPTLKIGFLNSDVQNLLDHYMDVYDVVLVQDQSMKIPDTVVQVIATGSLKGQ